jgi:hypothetical protein
MPFETKRIVDVLNDALRDDGSASPNPNPSLNQIVERLGQRSFGIVLVLFGLPNLLPIPGLPMVCGLVIGVVALQLLLGSDALQLPAWLSARRLRRADLLSVIDKARPTLRRLERIMRPRLLQLTSEKAHQLLGFFLLLLAIALMAPIPFFGGIAPGIAVTFFGLALVERDGVFVLLGILASALALVITGALTYAILRQIHLWFSSATGLA